jgi:hypothetical protein
MPMGRPRSRHKDNPPYFHQKAGGPFYFRGPIAGKVTYQAFKSRDRNKALDEYWKFRKELEPGEAGTLGEIIDLYKDHPTGIAAVGSSDTRDEYKRQLPIIRKLWGDKPYAITAEKALFGKGLYLRTVDLNDYLRSKEKKRGAVSANRIVRLVSRLFNFGIERSVTAYNPADGVRYNSETVRETDADRDALQKVIEHATPALALMLELASVTSIDQKPIRLMTKTQVGESLDAGRIKTGIKQVWEMTPYLRSIFERAKKLPGYAKSVHVFPHDKDGQPYTIEQFQDEFRAARSKAGATFQFRDIRKWNIRQAKAEGQDPQEFAAHAERRTTDRHYLNQTKRATPLK